MKKETKQVSFATRIKMLRKVHSMTQDDVVAVLRESGYKITKSGYQKWEKDGGLKRPPNIVALTALADYYKVPVHILIDWEFQGADDRPLGKIDYFKEVDFLPEEDYEALKNLYDLFLQKAVVRKDKTIRVEGGLENEE